MIELIAKGCTHAVDDAIHDARLQYARERDDFHSFFLNMTSVQVRAILRGQQRSDLRRDIVVRLFEAQQASPHELWSMLLVQACEAKLVERRTAVSKATDPQLDRLVLDTFVEALSDLPHWLEPEDLPSYVLRTSGKAFKKALRREHTETRLAQERIARNANRARHAFRQAHSRLVLTDD